MAAGTEPIISINLHATSASRGVSNGEDGLDARRNIEQTTMVTVALASMPNPCMENTAAMKEPLVLLLANSDIMVEDKG